jgi:S-adenosylmethionine:diacylglycerol 3-amino-3-carboxypropyl transferase
MTRSIEGAPGPQPNRPFASGEGPHGETGIEGRVALDRIRYSNVWEDADVLCEALRPGPGRRFLSIASGGDNAFALVGTGAEVVAADLSAAQIACTELKVAAIRELDGEPLLGFLGIRDDDAARRSRDAQYRSLGMRLSGPSRAHFAAHPEDVAGGLVHAGKFERYFCIFRTWVLPLVHGTGDIEELLAEKSVEERRAFYARRWDNRRWRTMFRFFFSRFMLGRLGRDPELFRYVEGPVAERILARGKYALTELPTHANPWLEYILRRNFVRTLPPYLRPERLAGVRANLDRLTLVCAPIDETARSHAGAGFDGFNLSDLFEYVDGPTSERIYGALLGAARPGARFAYWNMLAPRRCPAALAPRVRPLDDVAAELFRRDLAFFYSAFVLEEVR